MGSTPNWNGIIETSFANKDLFSCIQEKWNRFYEEYWFKFVKFMLEQIKAVIKTR